MEKNQLIKEFREMMKKGIPNEIHESIQSTLPVIESMLDDKEVISYFVTRYMTFSGGLIPHEYVNWCILDSKNAKQFIDRIVSADLAFRTEAPEDKTEISEGFGYMGKDKCLE